MKISIESFSQPDVERIKAAVSRLGDTSSDDAAPPTDSALVELIITGGPPGQRLQYRAAITQGAADVTHVNELRGVREEYSASVPAEELSTFARRLDVDALMDLPPNADEKYIPDSLVGLVILTAGNARVTMRFPLEDETPTDEDVAMSLDLGQGSFLLRESLAPPTVRPALEQLATVINRLASTR